MAKVFKLPPMRGNRMMIMSPAGGFTVILADLCEQAGFEFADPGPAFYQELQNYSNAGVINFSNPLDMGDIYDPELYAHVFYSVLHNENVDAAVYLTQWPTMPRGEDVFTKMFNTDISKDAIGALQSSGKPMGVCLYGEAETTVRIKQNINFPMFDSPEEVVNALKIQKNYYEQKKKGAPAPQLPSDMRMDAAVDWLSGKNGEIGEESLELMALAGIQPPRSMTADSAEGAVSAAQTIGYPVVLKVISPDALHKSDAGGVQVNIQSDQAVKDAFAAIQENLRVYSPDARFQKVRIMEMVRDGHDMFVGGKTDASFGPIVYFGFGGIYIEIFQDVKNVLCPAPAEEIAKKLKRLKTYPILAGTRGGGGGDIRAYVDTIAKISHLMYQFPRIRELDINPIRVMPAGKGAIALDARMAID